MKYVHNANTRQLIVSVAVTDVANKTFSFTSNNEIEKAKRIVSIESFHAGLVPISDKEKTVVAKAISDKAYLNIKNGTTTLRQLPLKKLTLDADSGKTDVEVINVEGWDMQSSNVEVGTITGLVADTVFLFLVTYEKA